MCLKRYLFTLLTPFALCVLAPLRRTGQVAYPGVAGVTDEEVGFSSTKQKLGNANSKDKSETGRPSASEAMPRQANSPPAKMSFHGDAGNDLACHAGKGDGEESALKEAAFGTSDLEIDAASRDMTLENLAKTSDVAELTESRESNQIESALEQTEGAAWTRIRADCEEGGRTQELGGEGLRRGPGSGVGQEANNTRWSWSRRGTEECSLYFRSDSGCEDHRIPSPSRRTSTASSSDTGGRGKRTVYLGRAQAFPLRRVESSLAVDARGFGLSGVSVDAPGEGLLLAQSCFYEACV